MNIFEYLLITEIRFLYRIGLYAFTLSLFLLPAAQLHAEDIPAAEKTVDISPPAAVQPATVQPATAQPIAIQAPPPQELLPAKKVAKYEFDREFDAYYTNVSVTFPLTDAPVPEVSEKSEYEIYRQLAKNAFSPRFFLLEAAVFPMPVLGILTKKHATDFYNDFNVGSKDLNLLEAITAGFQEPYAFSIFFGDVISFVRPGESKVSSNKGYMGYLASYSNLHIKRNVLIQDQSLELEWKLKGDRVFKNDKLSWSFRVGSKLHENPDIADTAYLGFRRSNLDFSADFLSFLNNSSIDFRWDFSMKDGSPLRQEYTVGKKIPISRWHIALKLDVGFIWENPKRYSGVLRDANTQNIAAVFRPNIEF